MTYYASIGEDSGELDIYIPYTDSFSSLTTTDEQLGKISDLTQVLEQCGIGPIANTQYNQEEACSVTIA